MRRFLAILAMGMAAGCASGGQGQSIKANQIPASVQGAFYSEHPYAQINEPNRLSNPDGSTSYEIPYTRPDGTKGTATYAQMGELQKDQ